MDLRSMLDNGQLIPPSDDVTANALQIWENSPPLYHDLKCIPYTAFDVREWTGKLRKYKAEVVAYADRCRNLEKEVAELQQSLAGRTGHVADLERRHATAQTDSAELDRRIKEETSRCNITAAECTQLRRARDQLRKQRTQLAADIAQTLVRIGNLQREVEQNRERHQAVLGEKERLKLERRWFFRERLLLEETTLVEVKDISLMKEKLEKLRHCLQKAWRDAKEIDLLGHLRATRKVLFGPEWYAARQRIIPARGDTAMLQGET